MAQMHFARARLLPFALACCWPQPRWRRLKAVNHRGLEVRAGSTITHGEVMPLSLNADVVVIGKRTFTNLADVENPAEDLVGIATSASQGYADINFLIPELVAGVQYSKGPYFADQGDLSTAGAGNISYATVLDRPLAHLETGTYDYGRALFAASPKVGRG